MRMGEPGMAFGRLARILSRKCFLIALAVFPLLSCLDEYPLIRPGEFTDVRSRLVHVPGMADYDSVRVEIRDSKDSGRIISAWTVSGDSLSKIPLQFRSKGEVLLVRVRGYLDSVGYCYSAWYEEDRLVASLDSCDRMPRIVDIRSFSPGDTTISINDSVVLRATVSSQQGILKEFRWDFDGDGAPDSSGPLSGGTQEISATRRFGNSLGDFGVRLSVYDADSNSISNGITVTVDLDAPRARLGRDTSVALGDSLSLKGTGTDGKGRIVAVSWFGLGDTVLLGDGEKLAVKGAEIGVKTYVFRVVDDDGLVGLDTISVTTTQLDSNASLKAIYVWPGILNPEFAPSRTTYRIDVPGWTDSIKLTARPASANSTVSFPDFPEASGKGDLFRTLPFSMEDTILRIKVISVSGAEEEYQIKVNRVSGSGGTPLGYARVPDPANQGTALGSALAYNSAGKAVQFSRTGTGRYRLSFPGLGQVGGEGHVQVTAYGAVPGHCSVDSWGGTDFAANLACVDATGADADLPFGVSATWPRPHSSGGNAFISDDIVPSASGQKAKAASAYNSYNGAATGAITVAKIGTGITETAFIRMGSDAVNPGNALVTLHGKEPGWCKISDISMTGSDVTVVTACFRESGAPADYLFSLSAISPTIGARDFSLGYAIAPGPSGFDDSLPDPSQAFNSEGGPISSKRLGKGRYQVRFQGMEAAGQDRSGVVQVSAYGGTGPLFCQVGDWKPAEASADILCSDAAGYPEDSRFSIQVIR